MHAMCNNYNCNLYYNIMLLELLHVVMLMWQYIPSLLLAGISLADRYEDIFAENTIRASSRFSQELL